MDGIKTLRKTAGFLLGIGILAAIVSIVIIILGIYVSTIKEDSSFVQAIVTNENFSELSAAFANEGLDDVQGIRVMGIGIIFIGFVALIASIFNIIRGVLGFKAADGSCFTGAMVIGIIGLVFDILAFVLAVINSGAIIIKAVYAAIAGLYVYGVHASKNEYEEAKIQAAMLAANKDKVSTESEAADFFN